MKIGKGVEWAAHGCAILALLPPDQALSRDALADFLGVPAPYLAKQMQALSRAGLVVAQRGASGGYRLAKPPAEISLWDITAAVEGNAPVFRCTEIRRNGPCGAGPSECEGPCNIAAAFWRAEAGYRQTLAGIALSELVDDAARSTRPDRKRQISDWLGSHAARQT